MAWHKLARQGKVLHNGARARLAELGAAGVGPEEAAATPHALGSHVWQRDGRPWRVIVIRRLYSAWHNAWQNAGTMIGTRSTQPDLGWGIPPACTWPRARPGSPGQPWGGIPPPCAGKMQQGRLHKFTAGNVKLLPQLPPAGAAALRAESRGNMLSSCCARNAAACRACL